MHLSSFYIHDGKYYHVDQKCNLAEHPSVLQHKTCNIYFPEHLEHPPIPCTSVFKLISSVPDLLHRFLCVTGNCNKCTVTRLRILSYKMLRSRLVYYFMEHKISPDTALLEHNQVQLAEYLGVTRPALSKEINKMMKEGLISINKKVVTLEDMAALKEYI